jgi:hypothetical protein
VKGKEGRIRRKDKRRMEREGE